MDTKRSGSDLRRQLRWLLITITWPAVLVRAVLIWGITFWVGGHPQQGLGSGQPVDLIVVLDGGSSRLSVAEAFLQRILYGHPQ